MNVCLCTNLTSHGDFLALFKTNGALLLVVIIEDNGHGSLVNTRLPTLVNQILQVLSAYLTIKRDECHA